MTREDAISIMNVIVHMLEEKYDTDRVEDAVDMAIKALKQEPCEDAISRAWIKEAIHNLYRYSRHTPTEEDLQEYIVDDAHSVTPKQRIGHWVKISPAGIYECSECGQNVMTGDIDAYRHCHGCGAKMSENPTGSSCTDCVLDGTDACTRGAGRAVDGRVCEDFVGESEEG